MKSFFADARLACLSLLCLLASFLLWGMLRYTGTSHRLGNAMDDVARFATLSPALIAVVLALAGFRWDRRRPPAVLALAAALLGTWVVFALGG